MCHRFGPGKRYDEIEFIDPNLISDENVGQMLRRLADEDAEEDYSDKYWQERERLGLVRMGEFDRNGHVRRDPED